jgi:hypothetical protein
MYLNLFWLDTRGISCIDNKFQVNIQKKYTPLFGDETGFIAFQNMKIAIDYFKLNFYFEQT